MAQAHKETDTKVTNLHKGEMSPVRRMLSPFDEIERLFEQMRSRDWLSPFHWGEPQSTMPLFAEGRMPKVDIIDRDKELLVRAELPGVDKKDLDISMTDNTLTLKASTHYEQKEEEGDYYRCEIGQGQYARTVSLPADVDLDKAKTTFKDGVLELTVPKLERSQRRNIKIE